MEITKKIDEGLWAVFVCGTQIGEVFYDPDAWSYARYFIVGGRRLMVYGGVNGMTRKFGGFRRLRSAAHELAIMNSSFIIRNMP